MTHGATMGGHVVSEAVKRAGIELDEVDDVIMGCAFGRVRLEVILRDKLHYGRGCRYQ